MLLDNLRYLRRELRKLHLEYDVIHSLIARVIFIQFLFQRKDKSGQPALDENFLRKLYEKEKVLSHPHTDLKEILGNYEDAYKFFRWLNDKFSGDLFPGNGAEQEREAEWQIEKDQVKESHLELLAEFVSGTVRMDSGQAYFWEMYQFDAIPLEFISSIYEVFVNEERLTDDENEEERSHRGVHYTPSYVVDFMLDRVLPWDGKEWDLRILDPACGSGIFLVKAFQRVVQCWKNGNAGQDPKPGFLRDLLKNNLFGIDIDPHAVRVASFSLYLALCDEIDPRYYWQQLKFPRLRERQVVGADFFSEDEPLFKAHQEDIKYDLIVGNAPWGSNSITLKAQKWAKQNNWETGYKDIGPLFLARAATQLKKDGYIAMIQPTAIISNQVEPSRQFRRRLFKEYKVEEVVNLSALRFLLFSKSGVHPIRETRS
jgi:type I restriction-modification system DNA methylase subunit